MTAARERLLVQAELATEGVLVVREVDELPRLQDVEGGPGGRQLGGCCGWQRLTTDRLWRWTDAWRRRGRHVPARDRGLRLLVAPLVDHDDHHRHGDRGQ